MTTFQMQFARWQAADRRAMMAERELARDLDEYCEGRAAVPSVERIAEAGRLRREALDAFRDVFEVTQRARRDLRRV